MDKNNNHKIILVSFVVAAFLAALVVGVLLEAAAAAFGFVARAYATDIVKHGAPFLGGLITFLSLILNKKIRSWADEVVVEIKKVVWPSQKDTVAMTTVVCVMLLISGVVLWVFDFLSSNLVKSMLNM